MKIGIIGAGQIGGTLARLLTTAGHQVTIANSRGPETLSRLAAETGATPATVKDTLRGKDLIVVTIPEKEVAHLPSGLFKDVPKSVPVVDTGNYYPRQRDGRIDPIEDGMTESRWVEQQLGHPVIKAFNTMYARSLGERGKSAGTPGRIALPVAGDDLAAKQIVAHLIDQIGFDTVDTGGLDDSWRQQPGTPAYTAELDAAAVRDALSKASKERKPEWRGTAKSPGSFAAPA